MATSKEVKTDRILRIFSSVIGEGLPKVHNKSMFIERYDGKMVSAKRGEIEVTFEVTEDMTNPYGLLHGGISCTLMDDVIGLAAATLGGERFSVSLNLQVSYLDKVKIGENIIVKAKIIREGRNILNAVATIHNSSGKQVANGKSDLFLTEIKRKY
jgi:uncharacterized protein (TIGR00369 family)